MIPGAGETCWPFTSALGLSVIPCLLLSGPPGYLSVAEEGKQVVVVRAGTRLALYLTHALMLEEGL